MKRLILAFAIAPCLAIASPAQDAEKINFRALPNVGLKYKVTGTQSRNTDQTMTFGEQEPREMTMKTSSKYVFTHSILEIKDGKITKLSRKYEDYESKRSMEMSGMDPRDSENEAPLAWKHVRISWDDDEVNVEVEDEGEWSEPEESLRRAIRPKRWRRTPVPMPKEPKKVGDTWELTGEDAEKAFPRRPRRGRDGEMMELPDRELKVSYEFASIAEHNKMRCAVLKMKMVSEVGDTNRSESKYTIYYSIEHKIVVGVKMESKGSTSVEREIRDSTLTMEGEMTGKMLLNVKVLEPGKPADA